MRCTIVGCVNGKHIGETCLVHGGFIVPSKFATLRWGNTKTKDGYLVSRYKGKLTRVHRVVMEKYLGRELTKDEVVHHIDHNKQNNHISNLEVMTSKEHSLLHLSHKEPLATKLCYVCKELLPISKFKIQAYSTVTGLAKRKAKCRKCCLTHKAATFGNQNTTA